MNIKPLLFILLLAGLAFAQAIDENDPNNQFYDRAITNLDDATAESNIWSVRSAAQDYGQVGVGVGEFFASSVIGDEYGCDPPPNLQGRVPPITDRLDDFLADSISILVGVVVIAALLAALVYALGQAFGAEMRARAITLASSLLVSSFVVLVLFYVVYNFYPTLLAELGGEASNFNASVTLLAPAVTVALGVFAIAGALYVVGTFLQIPSITAAAKDEFFASVLTLVRVFAIGLAVIGVGTMFYSLAAVPGGEMDPVYASAQRAGGIDYLDASINISLNMLKEIVRNYGFMLISNTILHAMYTSTLFFGLTWRAMYSFSLGPVFRPLVDVLGQMMQFMQIAIAEWLVHAATLCAIKKWSWQLFIPFGVLLRAIPQTRGGGDALLALVFAFLIVYPLMFIVDYEIHKMLRGILVDPGDMVEAFVSNGGLGGIVATVGIMVFLTASVFMPLFGGAAINLIIELSRNAIYYIVIMSFVLPFINIFVTLTFAREQARFFNVDVNFMSFARLI